MAWLTVRLRPGFSADLISWQATLDRDGEVVQVVSAWSAGAGECIERHQRRLERASIAELSQLMAAIEFAKIQDAARRHNMDDMEDVSVVLATDEGTFTFEAPLTWWAWRREKEQFTFPGLEPALQFWRAMDRLLPRGVSGR